MIYKEIYKVQNW